MEHLNHLNRLGADCRAGGIGHKGVDQPETRGDCRESQYLEDCTAQ